MTDDLETELAEFATQCAAAGRLSSDPWERRADLAICMGERARADPTERNIALFHLARLRFALGVDT